VTCVGSTYGKDLIICSPFGHGFRVGSERLCGEVVLVHLENDGMEIKRSFSGVAFCCFSCYIEHCQTMLRLLYMLKGLVRMTNLKMCRK
jgi:hypothetical protein